MLPFYKNCASKHAYYQHEFKLRTACVSIVINLAHILSSFSKMNVMNLLIYSTCNILNLLRLVSFYARTK